MVAHVVYEVGRIRWGDRSGQGHDLGCVEYEPDIVEGRGNEAAGRDGSMVILMNECCLEMEWREEGPNRRHKHLQLRLWLQRLLVPD